MKDFFISRVRHLGIVYKNALFNLTNAGENFFLLIIDIYKMSTNHRHAI